ncbi:hypothetical protein [Nocardia acididurans]|uniref:hypothetical protein n=1 Tax=Nocardia acididurans TaxID=2802282 RepID=UPI001E5D9FD1|nr:hypothetical protein [Nocardia acididurans]
MRDGNTGKPQGNLNRIDCPSGVSLGQAAGFARPLARAYPRAVPGALTEVGAKGFTGVGTGRIEAWYPGVQRPNIVSRNVSGLALTQVAGGWRLTGDAAGAYSVEQSR